MCSTSTYDRNSSVGELRVIIAVNDDELRDQCVDAARDNLRLRLLTSSGDIADTRVDVQRTDVVVIGGTERSVHGVSAIAVARDLYPEALVLPVTHDDIPRRILELAAVAASDPPSDEHLPTASLTIDAVRMAIEADEPSLVFQPVVDLQDRRVIGLEALARFRLEPRHPPDVWFEAAHRVGL